MKKNSAAHGNGLGKDTTLSSAASSSKRALGESNSKRNDLHKNAASLFCCPICRSELYKRTNALVCKNGHTFDAAKEGYAHLLPSGKMRAKIPGDSREMVAARREFLAGGWYEIFADALCDILLDMLPRGGNVLDAGCGEGYYTRAVAGAFEKAELPLNLAAFDISKFAVKAAAKRSHDFGLIGADFDAVSAADALLSPVRLEYAVAGSFDIPVKDNFADAIINIFSPMAEAEFARALKKGGALIFAVPGARHLFGLKEVLYETPYLNEVKDVEYKHFTLEKRIPIRGKITVPKNQIMNLFSMTPYFWKTPKGGAEKLAALDNLETEIEFDFVIYKHK